ncbi:MAG: cytochrome c oxidase subunit [Bacteroidales bacterium]|jgi:cytochrome c oxidase subunit 3|nr:cytochrome c oxidase subunit [Bacteroidales bacterium]MDN5330330.1 cytochrome c oxidase subunit [Bacteroidales bacterium]
MSTNSSAGVHNHRDDEAQKMGMWFFLFTELLLFGGLFLVYSIYRFKNPEAFAHGAKELNVVLGTINTIILLTSSLTVALSITAIQKGQKKLALGLVLFTIFCALLFLVNKYFEWGHKFEIGIYPGSELLRAIPPGEALFFVLYYFMTGLHAIHVIVGAIILAFMARYIHTGFINSNYFVLLENGALYWHLVDLIWIFLFPLLYLIH